MNLSFDSKSTKRIPNIGKSAVLFPGLLVLFYGSSPVEGFINNPLRQIVVTRALQSSMVEIITLNTFDQSAILQQLVCDCEENKYVWVYLASSIYFGYSFWNNLQSDSKLANVPAYSESKRWIKRLLIVLFLILGKDINNAI